MSGIHYTSYVRPCIGGFEYGYIEQALGHVDISQGFQGTTVRRKTHHVHGSEATFDAALAKMAALPLKSFGGVSSEEEEA